ncbi:MAG TPA: PSD1 and planctomycete cytochrome C domain-containing protein [Pirellulales bacterium]|nr:PSD1 and planctomycete cytochrome C domain-containing protein [Pirellulales bacterium]
MAVTLAACGARLAAAAPPERVELARDVLPLLKAHCAKCHGPAKQEANLNLSSPGLVARGGDTGSPVVAGKPDESLLWQRVEADEMPPDAPLSAVEKKLLRSWIESGAAGLAEAGSAKSEHWAFAHLGAPKVPAVKHANADWNEIDAFLLAELVNQGIEPNPIAERPVLIRRVAFDLTGLPPTPQEIAVFVSDPAPEAYERMVERYLASPRYGERWGKLWLDAAGYADSNGYFNADTDRPLAYRYRDYVVRSFNEDKPFDRFVLEQIAGDELSGYVPERPATPEMISLLEATHYLRNGQDGSGESDGNADEVRIDRYTALESTMQIVGSSLLGLTVQCAKCHDHKFEPITQRDYYQLQAVFYPAYDIARWLKPNERFVYANLPGELEAWEGRKTQTQAAIAGLKAEFNAWVRKNPLPAETLFQDAFDEGQPLAGRWSDSAPGDDAAAASAAVTLDQAAPVSATQEKGALVIRDAGGGDKWLSTRASFDWTPDEEGQWVQATFDLVAVQVDGSAPAARIGYFIALHDFNDNSAVAGGNVLVDGNPAGGAAVHLDYPGADASVAGDLGTSKYETGHNYGVRLTREKKGKLKLEHLVDGLPDEKSLTLDAKDVPDGGFGFELCCGRSYVVDNVVVSRSPPSATPGSREALAALETKRKELREAVAAQERALGEKPGKLAVTFDREGPVSDVPMLVRGNPATPGEAVPPGPLSALADGQSSFEPRSVEAVHSTGRRLAWARWLMEPGSRAAALVARVQVNRIWQHHFGAGLVRTSDNLGTSGAHPSHPELLEYLAARFVESGWSVKAMHREMLRSAAYRRTSASNSSAAVADPDNRLLWRASLRRLDAESIRDAILAVSGQLAMRMGGPYLPTKREESGEVVVGDASAVGRRSLYLQQRRTQTLSVLNVFDAPSIVFNCVERPRSTMPLQSLSLLNSDFVVAASGAFAERIAGEVGDAPETRVQRAYETAFGRPPDHEEQATAIKFVARQREVYADSHAGSDSNAGSDSAEAGAWRDFCQMLLASSPFLYVE